jgi:hypothetical protein
MAFARTIHTQKMREKSKPNFPAIFAKTMQKRPEKPLFFVSLAGIVPQFSAPKRGIFPQFFVC